MMLLGQPNIFTLFISAQSPRWPLGMVTLGQLQMKKRYLLLLSPW